MATTKLEQTKGQFKLMGKVKGIENENALREGTTKSDKPYKALSFFVETSPTNAIKVEMFAMERDVVYAYSSKAKETKKVNWADRHKNHNDYKVIGVRLGLEKGEDGKNIVKQLVEWDAVEELTESLKDGDSVFVSGNIDFQQFKNKEGVLVESTKYQIGQVSKTKKPVDFDAEDFTEMSQFEQEVVITGAEIDKTDKENPKLMVTAKTINYKGEDTDTTFIVEAGKNDKLKKLATNMKKRFKFGDFIKVFGLCVNRTELEEAEESVEEDDWGGETDVKDSFNNNYIRNYIQELQITSVDSSTYEPKKYKEEDFFNEDEDSFGDDNVDLDGDDFSDEDTGMDDDDDLPFE